MASNSVKDNLN